MSVKKCRECGAAIEFARNERTWRMMPLDVGGPSSPPPNLLPVGRDGTGVLVVRILRGAELLRVFGRHDEILLRRAHFATCTKPEAFRRRGRAA